MTITSLGPPPPPGMTIDDALEVGILTGTKKSIGTLRYRTRT